MHTRHRRILPATDPSGGGAEQPPAPKRKRTSVRVACDNCRSKKAACDGNRPTCGGCFKSKVECQYMSTTAEETSTMARNKKIERLTNDLRGYQTIIQQLRDMPEDEALTLVRRLRSATDLSTVLAFIQGNVAPNHSSELETTRNILPSIHSNIEVELMMHYKLMYPALPPLDATFPDLDHLISRSSRLSPAPDTSSPHAPSQQSLDGASESSATIDPVLAITTNTALQPGVPEIPALPTTSPFSSPTYCDSRLNDLDISYWTNIPISNEFAASTISVYLENEHPVLGVFDADLVLRDLVAHNLRYCSSFLVNALLCISCQCFSKFDSRASSLSRSFRNEAEKLWYGERASNSITSLAAMHILGIAMMWQGLEEKALKLMTDVRHMAEQMNLIGVPHTPHISHSFRQMPPDEIRATSHVAWGCYCFLSFYGSFYREDPIALSPALPIPGHEGTEESDEESVPSWPPHRLPLYMGKTFPALCKYWRIAQEVQVFYFTHSNAPLPTVMPLAFAEEKYQKLLAWTNTLDNTHLSRRQGSSAHVWILHSLYHTVVLDIFRPLLRRGLQLKSFVSLDGTPETVFNASVRQLQRLLVEYVSWVDPRLYSPFLNAAAVQLSSLILRDTQDSSWRFYFMLCMAYWKEVFVRHPVIGKVVQAILSLGMREGSIGGVEAQALLLELQQQAQHHEIKDMATDCIIDFDRAMSDKDNGRAKELAQKFDELAIFKEFTTGDFLLEQESDSSKGQDEN